MFAARRAAARCSNGCSEERTLYDELMARALRLASTTFEDIDVDARPSSSRARRCCSTMSAARSGADAGHDAHAATDDGREDAAGAAARRVHRHRGPDGGDRIRASRSRPAALQPRRLDLLDGHGTGAVGVIGPTRMRYSRAINAVESLSKAISRMIKSASETCLRCTCSPVPELDPVQTRNDQQDSA